MAVAGFSCLLLAWRPLHDSRLWWELSRGRAVLEGSWTPSSSLLAADQQAEADWLGGVPFYLLFQTTGLNGLMLLKLLAHLGLVLWSWRSLASVARPLQIGMTSLIALLCVTVADVTPLVWDAWGIVLATTLAQREPRSAIVRLCLWGALALIWANLAPHSLLIFWPLLTVEPFLTVGPPPRPGGKSPARPGRLLPALSCAGGLCLTPRGFRGLSDSAHLLAPPLFSPSDVLRETDWSPLWTAPSPLLLISWTLLALVLLGTEFLRQRHAGRWIAGRLLAMAFVISLGYWSQATVGLMALAAVPFLAARGPLSESNDASRSPVSGSQTVAEAAVTGAAVAEATVTLAGLIVASLMLSGLEPDYARSGWGLAPRLQIDEFAESLGSAQRARSAPKRLALGTAHGPDLNAIGMLSWSRRVPIVPDLTLQRAFLSGRLAGEVGLNRDLRAGRLRQFQRVDGTTGGWWIPLRERNALLILAPRTQTRLHHSLNGTIWKPLAIESPIIPYALAGYPLFAARLEQISAAMEARNSGQPEPPQRRQTANRVTGDLYRGVTGVPDLTDALETAALWRAWQMPLAAARTLQPLQRRPELSRWIAAELRLIQTALAEQEWLAAGETTPFRQQVLAAIDSSRQTQPPEHAISLYLQGQPGRALEQLGTLKELTANTPATWATKAYLAAEAGEFLESQAHWRGLLEQFPDSPWALTARQALVEKSTVEGSAVAPAEYIRTPQRLKP